MTPILLDSAVVLSAALFQTFSSDEQALIGAFLTTVGDMLSLNSAYLSLCQSQQDSMSQDDQIDVLKQGLDKLKEELEKIKQEN